MVDLDLVDISLLLRLRPQSVLTQRLLASAGHSSDFEMQPRHEKRPLFQKICPRGGSTDILILHILGIILLRYYDVQLYKLPQRNDCSCGLTAAGLLLFYYAFLGVEYLYFKIVK